MSRAAQRRLDARVSSRRRCRPGPRAQSRLWLGPLPRLLPDDRAPHWLLPHDVPLSYRILLPLSRAVEDMSVSAVGRTTVDGSGGGEGGRAVWGCAARCCCAAGWSRSRPSESRAGGCEASCTTTCTATTAGSAAAAASATASPSSASCPNTAYSSRRHTNCAPTSPYTYGDGAATKHRLG